ncbi:LIM domain-containing protein [Ditylenchus destructor]|uniref:LIM domain-containing protein n=1 Tax=Ditylenchus destructor TaxID=166010 RepID=A0AAD4QYP0_9BILA|nr:LIM domain-containing protein [Ditylenchus destructor]
MFQIYCKECVNGSTGEVYQNGKLQIVYNNQEGEKWRATVSDVPQFFKRSETFNAPAGFSVRRYDDMYRTTILPKAGTDYASDLFSQSAASLPEPYIGPSASLRNRPTWTMKSHTKISDSSNNGVSLSRSSTCQRCSKVVFLAEKVVAASSVWHKTCFRCRECGRSLEPGKFCDRDNEVFCGKCYAKNFGPKGVGCGIGAGILQMHQ